MYFIKNSGFQLQDEYFSYIIFIPESRLIFSFQPNLLILDTSSNLRYVPSGFEESQSSLPLKSVMPFINKARSLIVRSFPVPMFMCVFFNSCFRLQVNFLQVIKTDVVHYKSASFSQIIYIEKFPEWISAAP